MKERIPEEKATIPETLLSFSGPFPFRSDFTNAHSTASTCHHKAQPPNHPSSKRELSFFVQYRAHGSAAISTPANAYAKSVQTSHSPPTKHLHTQPPRSKVRLGRPCGCSTGLTSTKHTKIKCLRSTYLARFHPRTTCPLNQEQVTEITTKPSCGVVNSSHALVRNGGLLPPILEER